MPDRSLDDIYSATPKRKPSLDELYSGDTGKPTWGDRGITTALRVVPGVVGGIAGAAIGGAGGAVAGSAVPVAGTLAGGVEGGIAGAAIGGGGGSALGEWLAEKYEKARGLRKDINLKNVAVQGVIGAVPMGKAASIASGALKGAALGAGSTIATSYAENGELPGAGDVALGAATGGALGGGTSAVAKWLRGARGAAPVASEAVPSRPVAAPLDDVARANLADIVGVERPSKPGTPFDKLNPSEQAKIKAIHEELDAMPYQRANSIDTGGSGGADVGNVSDISGGRMGRGNGKAQPDAPRWVGSSTKSFLQERQDGGNLNANVAGSPLLHDINGVHGGSQSGPEVISRLYDYINGGKPSTVTDSTLTTAQRLLGTDNKDATALLPKLRGPKMADASAPWIEQHADTPEKYDALQQVAAALKARGLSERDPRFSALINSDDTKTILDLAHGHFLDGESDKIPATVKEAVGYMDIPEPAAMPEAAPDGGGKPPVTPIAMSPPATGPPTGKHYFTTDPIDKSVPRQKPRTAGVPNGVAIQQPNEALAEFERATLERDGGKMMNDAGRGIQPVARTKALGEQTAIGNLEHGKNFDSPEAYWAHGLRKSMVSEQLAGVMDRIQRGVPLPDDAAALDSLTKSYPEILAQFTGGKSEAGRTMRLMREPIPGGVNQAFEKGIEGARKVGMTEAEILTLLRSAKNSPEAWVDALRAEQTKRQPLGSWLRGVYTGNILSGPKTQIRNVVGNAASLATRPALLPVEAAIDRFTTPAGADRTVYGGEVGAQLGAVKGGLSKGWDEMKHVLTKGYSKDVLTSSTFDQPRVEFAGGGKNPWNAIGRVMEGADALFRNVSGEMEMAGLSYTAARNQAKKLGIAPGTPEFRALVEQIKAAPTKDMLDQANTAAQRATFQEKPGPITSWVLSGKKSNPWLHYIVPFVKTPANVLRQGLEMTPAGFAMKGTKAAQGARAASAINARAAVGTAALAPLWLLAASGRLSGAGPTDASERAELMERGWRPNSVKIGDTWHSYAPLQPMALPASMVANAYEAWDRSTDPKKDEDVGGIAATTAAAVGKSILDQSYLASVGGLLAAVNDPERAGSGFVARMLQGAVPLSGAVRTAAQVADPVLRKPETLGQAVERDIPGFSTNVNPRLGRFGQEIMRDGGPVARGLNIFNSATETSDPVAKKLEELGVSLQPVEPVKKISRGRNVAPIVLSDADAFAGGKAQGTELYNLLLPMISRPGFDQMPSNVQRDAVEQTISRARAVARKKLMGKSQ